MDIKSKLLYTLLALVLIFLLFQILSEKTLVLTVDAEGDSTQIRNILDVLKDEKIRATFFLVGKTCEEYPDLCKEIAGEHEIACHTYSHANLKVLSKKDQRDEINKGRDTIKNITGVTCSGFRAPYFKADNTTYKILEEEGFYYDISGAALLLKRFTPTLWGEWYSTSKLGLSYEMHWSLVKIIFNLKRSTTVTIHPQYTADTEEHLSLFREFIQYAKAKNTKIITLEELAKR